MIDQPGGGIDAKGGAADDQQISLSDIFNSASQDIIAQRLAVEHHIWLDDTAAVTARNIPGFKHADKGMGCSACHAIAAMDAAVQLQHIPAAG